MSGSSTVPKVSGQPGVYGTKYQFDTTPVIRVDDCRGGDYESDGVMSRYVAHACHGMWRFSDHWTGNQELPCDHCEACKSPEYTASAAALTRW